MYACMYVLFIMLNSIKPKLKVRNLGQNFILLHLSRQRMKRAVQPLGVKDNHTCHVQVHACNK